MKWSPTTLAAAPLLPILVILFIVKLGHHFRHMLQVCMRQVQLSRQMCNYPQRSEELDNQKPYKQQNSRWQLAGSYQHHLIAVDSMKGYKYMNRRRLAPFQLCLACKCCISSGDPTTCSTMPCCFVIDCQLPNKPFGVCAFVPKTCSCTSCTI